MINLVPLMFSKSITQKLNITCKTIKIMFDRGGKYCGRYDNVNQFIGHYYRIMGLLPVYYARYTRAEWCN